MSKMCMKKLSVEKIIVDTFTAFLADSIFDLYIILNVGKSSCFVK